MICSKLNYASLFILLFAAKDLTLEHHLHRLIDRFIISIAQPKAAASPPPSKAGGSAVTAAAAAKIMPVDDSDSDGEDLLG